MCLDSPSVPSVSESGTWKQRQWERPRTGTGRNGACKRDRQSRGRGSRKDVQRSQRRLARNDRNRGRRRPADLKRTEGRLRRKKGGKKWGEGEVWPQGSAPLRG